MHGNNFAPAIDINPIYSFMKSKPALAGIPLGLLVTIETYRDKPSIQLHHLMLKESAVSPCALI